MSGLSFGDVVRVEYEARRLYGNLRHPEIPKGEPSPSRWQILERDRSRVVLEGCSAGREEYPTDGDWPGEPLPEPSELPQTVGDYARVRRFPCGESGYVVGFTWRTEGQRFGGSSYADDYEPATFNQSRRVDVVQVALEPVTGPARIVFAIPSDVCAAVPA